MSAEARSPAEIAIQARTRGAVMAMFVSELWFQWWWRTQRKGADR